MQKWGWYRHESLSLDSTDLRQWDLDEYDIVPPDKEVAVVAAHYGVSPKELQNPFGEWSRYFRDLN